jgi:hypothetical protein
VMIAMALANRPDLLIADDVPGELEATGNEGMVGPFGASLDAGDDALDAAPAFGGSDRFHFAIDYRPDLAISRKFGLMNRAALECLHENRYHDSVVRLCDIDSDESCSTIFHGSFFCEYNGLGQSPDPVRAGAGLSATAPAAAIKWSSSMATEPRKSAAPLASASASPGADGQPPESSHPDERRIDLGQCISPHDLLPV